MAYNNSDTRTKMNMNDKPVALKSRQRSVGKTGHKGRKATKKITTQETNQNIFFCNINSISSFFLPPEKER